MLLDAYGANCGLEGRGLLVVPRTCASYGGTKHAGYGLGFERLIMYITGVGNIRDVLPFPRTTGSAEF